MSQQVEKKTIKSPELAKPYAPYSLGVRLRKVGSFIFVSGVVPNDVNGDIVCKGDIKGQVKQVLHNLKITLEAAGVTPNDVVKLNTYIVSTYMEEYVKNKVDFDYLLSFPTPCDTLVGVACLANEGQLVEVEVLAVTA